MEDRPRLYQHIPNLLTLMNLSCGFVAITFVFNRNLEAAAYSLIFAAVFDFLDGFSARMLNAISEKGKVLDSISDVVSFGVAPAALIFLMITFSLDIKGNNFDLHSGSITERIFLFTSLIFLIASAWRLANFTVQKNSPVFYGLPTPPASLFFAGLAVIISSPDESGISSQILELYIIIPLVILISFLMVSKITFLPFKFRNFRLRDNIYQYILIIISVISLIFLRKFAISLIIIIYIFLSIITSFIKKTSET